VKAGDRVLKKLFEMSKARTLQRLKRAGGAGRS
jgi:hypothetical protein